MFFYCYFCDVDELGLMMVDESGLMLCQLMCQVCQWIVKGGSVICILVFIFMEFIGNNLNVFCLLLCECLGIFVVFCVVVVCEIQYFIVEFVDYLEFENYMLCVFIEVQVEVMVIIVFSVGVEVLDVGFEQCWQLEEWLVLQF